MAMAQRIRCAILRGGTSKGIFLLTNDLPQDPVERDKVICRIFGSPDVRQIDGLGGADPLTSKLAIIGRSTRPDADIDYTFGQVGINTSYVDYSGNCGNISSAVGPFAIDEGLVNAREGTTVVRIHNTNTQKLIIAEVPTHGGRADVDGTCAIDGVPGFGAKIMLDWSDTAGAVTGKMLPTGNAKDVLDIPGFGPLTVSIVDVANPTVFVNARDVKMTGTEGPAAIDGNAELLRLLESIRGLSAARIGMAKDEKDALANSPAFPMLAVVSSPADYKSFTTGETIPAGNVDIVSRLMFMQKLHKTYPGTGTICTGAAIHIPGTVANDIAGNAGETISIGHPSGVIEVEVSVSRRAQDVVLTRAAMSRTARRIMDGFVYI